MHLTKVFIVQVQIDGCLKTTILSPEVVTYQFPTETMQIIGEYHIKHTLISGGTVSLLPYADFDTAACSRHDVEACGQRHCGAVGCGGDTFNELAVDGEDAELHTFGSDHIHAAGNCCASPCRAVGSRFIHACAILYNLPECTPSGRGLIKRLAPYRHMQCIPRRIKSFFFAAVSEQERHLVLHIYVS